MSRLDNILSWPELAQQSGWCAKSLATQCGVSRRTLERHFLKTFGQSPKAWMTALRQKQAVKLLQNHTSIKETAWLVGYAHASTFAREFKKHAGQCPNDPAKPLAQTSPATGW